MKSIAGFQQRYQFNLSTDHLGEGGFGQVYKAMDTERDVYVAIKRAEKRADRFTLERVYNLVRSLPVHPNILGFLDYHSFDLGIAGEVEFLVLDYYEEGNLKAFLQNHTITADTFRRLVTGILEGIHFLHQQGIIHRDVKPANILLARKHGVFVPKVADFGLVKQDVELERSGLSNSSIGLTLAYAAPEQILGEPISPNLDLWAFGVMLYEMCTGELPFQSDAPLSTQRQAILRRKITEAELPEDLKDIEQPYQELIRRCLVRDRKKRVQSAAELLALLQEEEVVASDIKETPLPLPHVEKAAAQEVVHKEIPPANTPAANTSNPKQSASLKTAGVAILFIALLAGGWYFLGFGSALAAPIEDLEASLVRVAGGQLTVGCTPEQDNCDKDEDPVEQIELSAFEISKYEVTQAQWEAVMGNNPSKHKDCPNCPVEQVNWYDVEEFSQKLSELTGDTYRLPTEAEWEYAARGGQQSKGYRFAGGNVLMDVAWCGANSDQETHPVGEKLANELGLHDMAGNVWEWCLDGARDYESGLKTNPKGPMADRRVLRGASWYDGDAYARVANRFSVPLSPRNHANGFRIVRELE